MSESPWGRIRSATLSAKLILFSALLTALAVGVAFLALSLELRKHTRRLLAETLAQNQKMLLEVQTRGLQELLRASTLMSDSPTLRAAMETYRAELTPRAGPRADLLATVQTEAEKIAGGLGRDLLIVTDRDGRVLAVSGRPEDRPGVGEDLSSRPIVRHALEQDGPVGTGNFSVLRIRGRYFQTGCVPIVLQGFIIGTLTLGDRIDQGFVEHLGRSFDSEIVVTGGESVLGSTLSGAGWRGSATPTRAREGDEATDAAAVVSIGRDEYVTAPLTLGADEDGRPVTLHLLHSLTRALDEANRSLLRTLLEYGSLVVLVAGLCASVVARSVLSPLERFVKFMRQAADGGGQPPVFDPSDAGAEVRVLSETFSRLMDSLRRHEERLLTAAREDLLRLERLKESEKLAALGRLLAGAAHEINNPLTGVVGNIEILLAREGIAPDVRQTLETIRKEGQRTVALVRNLLKVAHRDGGQRTIVDINQMIRDTAALRRHDFERAGMRIVLDLAPAPVRLPAVELEIQQVFLNIINNAYDALKTTRGRPELTIRTSGTDDQATVVFTDNGPGIEDPSQVFEHFYTTKPVGQGTGLGLSISHAIVESHGGRITAENAAEGGARFTVVLPRAASPSADAAPPRAAAEPLPAPRRLLPISVLVVDDEPVVLELQMAILGSLGAKAVAARSGAEAIELLRKRDFDLIVSDLLMPGEQSGKDLYHWVAAHRRSGTRGFLFVTGDTLGEEVFLEEVKSRCVLKPFTMEEYVSALRETWHELQSAA
ncbi:MAG TPA: ATP-binding protein [Candidatus Polarisedimenticolia bacterium]|nr:ATP-binding protein [Candidatus Polarisedimenticolia bacterium]